jgi:hypothetical protein
MSPREIPHNHNFRRYGIASWTGPGNPFHHSPALDSLRQIIILLTDKDDQDRLYFRPDGFNGKLKRLDDEHYHANYKRLNYLVDHYRQVIRFEQIIQ